MLGGFGLRLGGQPVVGRVKFEGEGLFAFYVCVVWGCDGVEVRCWFSRW